MSRFENVKIFALGVAICAGLVSNIFADPGDFPAVSGMGAAADHAALPSRAEPVHAARVDFSAG